MTTGKRSSDLYVENHFEYFAQRLEGMGLNFSTEGGYGWASAIADGLRIEACAEMPMGEAWHAQQQPITGKLLDRQFEIHHMDPNTPLVQRALPYGFGLNSVRLAASAAHIYGKPFCPGGNIHLLYHERRLRSLQSPVLG